METPLTKPDVRVAHFPTYDNARIFLNVVNGYTRRTFLDMRDTLYDNRGTPQEVRDWSEPNLWIPELLSGKEKELATKLWEVSKGELNPRHTRGLWLLCSSYSLCASDSSDRLQITALGQDFLRHEEGEAVWRIDFSEGVLALLAIVAEQGPGKRSDLLPHFGEFLLGNSRVQAPSAISSRWYERMMNMIARGLIRREGVTYTIESKGLEYLEQVSNLTRPESPVSPAVQALNDLLKLREKQATEVRESLLQSLRQMHPYRFEHVIKALLQAMGYENVEVTKQSNDGGVDVVGDITVGITSIREVVQAKRYQDKSKIQRKTLDELRGSLHRFKAYKGTIITTGRFSEPAKQAAFEQGAAPITLIDGEELVTLLIQNDIGVRQETVSVLKFHPEDFDTVNTENDDRDNS